MRGNKSNVVFTGGGRVCHAGRYRRMRPQPRYSNGPLDTIARSHRGPPPGRSISMRRCLSLPFLFMTHCGGSQQERLFHRQMLCEPRSCFGPGAKLLVCTALPAYHLDIVIVDLRRAHAEDRQAASNALLDGPSRGSNKLGPPIRDRALEQQSWRWRLDRDGAQFVASTSATTFA